ncbi:MAG: MdtA/MuxA family multidrug efflux RND transporter periplasmic adaptor subunit [Humidesulfovibrio sp.]|nr:MdtA/MuxA family multidrug efflux RND transporter periplasmic adaptor subunit [Humidesulfovibrio sp.]
MSETAPLSESRRKTKRLFLLLAAICLATAVGAYWYKAASTAKQSANSKNRPQPVVVAEAKAKDVEVFLSSLGTVTPLNTVTVKSRVDGQLMQVLFREGQMVKAGDLLLVIDPRPFQVQLAQAEGQLRRDTALLENTRADLKRYAELMAQGAIARQQYDTQFSLVKQYEGTVATDKATVDSARLQITYSRITAPVSGQVGLRQVDPGNMVHASDTNGLLIVNQIAPINVVFTLPEDQLPKVLEKLRAGGKLRVDAYDREQTRKLAEGELASLDNQIDTSTGTVKLKATFANAKGELYPNQFVNAKLLLEVLKDAIVVPASAVQRGQQGAYLYVVSPEGVAQARSVSVGESSDGENVIFSGLNLGEKVVVDGADRLSDGAKVEIKTPRAKPADKSGDQPTAQPDGQQNATRPNAALPAAVPAPKATAEAKPAASKPEAHKAAAAATPVDPKPVPQPKAKADTKPARQAQAAPPDPHSKPDHTPDAAPAQAQDVQAGSQPQAQP